MKNKKVCDCCGANIVEYRHSLSKSLVRCLAVASKRGDKVFNPNNLNLNYNQKSNFQKLKYWNLITKSDPLNQKGGGWFITSEGWDFLNDKLSLHKNVWTFRGEVVRYEGDKLSITGITGGWKYRPEYAAEAVAHE